MFIPYLDLPASGLGAKELLTKPIIQWDAHYAEVWNYPHVWSSQFASLHLATVDSIGIPILANERFLKIAFRFRSTMKSLSNATHHDFILVSSPDSHYPYVLNIMTTCAFSKILQGWRLGRTKRDSNKDDEEKAVESGAANMPSSRLSPSSEDPLARYQTNDDYIPEVASDPNGSPPPRQSTETNHTDDLPQVHQIKKKKLHFWEGGVRPRHHKLVRFIGRCGFIAKGMVYGIIGVLIATTITGTYTPNGSGGNESPQVQYQWKLHIILSSTGSYIYTVCILT